MYEDGRRCSGGPSQRRHRRNRELAGLLGIRRERVPQNTSETAWEHILLFQVQKGLGSLRGDLWLLPKADRKTGEFNNCEKIPEEGCSFHLPQKPVSFKVRAISKKYQKVGEVTGRKELDCPEQLTDWQVPAVRPSEIFQLLVIWHRRQGCHFCWSWIPHYLAFSGRHYQIGSNWHWYRICCGSNQTHQVQRPLSRNPNLNIG